MCESALRDRTNTIKSREMLLNAETIHLLRSTYSGSMNSFMSCGHSHATKLLTYLLTGLKTRLIREWRRNVDTFLNRKNALSIKICVLLYKPLIRPPMDFACRIWEFAARKHVGNTAMVFGL